jgi:hypothetical protein
LGFANICAGLVLWLHSQPHRNVIVFSPVFKQVVSSCTSSSRTGSCGAGLLTHEARARAQGRGDASVPSIIHQSQITLPSAPAYRRVILVGRRHLPAASGGRRGWVCAGIGCHVRRLLGAAKIQTSSGFSAPPC